MKSRQATLLFLTVLIWAGRLQAQDVTADPASTSGAAAGEALLTPKLLHRIASDQKPIWTFPVHAAAGKKRKPALAVIGITAGLLALDPTDTPFFQRAPYRQNPAVHGIGHVLSGTTGSWFKNPN